MDAATEPLVLDEDAEQNYGGAIEYNNRIVRNITMFSQEAPRNRTSKRANRERKNKGASLQDRSLACLKVKLPRPELQQFSGAVTEWQLLSQQFWQAIHNNNALSNVGNFLYLQSALTEKAALAVATLQQTRANYNTVIERSKERFGHSNALLEKHLTQLFDLPNVQGGNEASGISRLYGHLQYNMSALTALDVKTNSYRAALSSTVLRMLPSELVIDKQRRCSADKEDKGLLTESLLEFFKTEVESRKQPIQVG